MEETERVARRLERMLKTGKIEDEPALKYLRRLKGIEMNLDILTKTGVGIIINKIRKESENPEVATLGKNIIKQWKKLVPAIPTGAYESEFLAIRIESAIYDLFNNTDSKYKQRVRTRVMNLRDSNNPNLRLNVLMGHVNPTKLASMTSEEMASKEMKELREKYTKETIEDHQMAVTGGTETDLLRCGKCKQTKCTYNQVQTRSADEPMTTFVYCNNCGHRWKVSH
ncbi:Transcription elongation factor A protein 2 [Fasciola hepatica]|uniref:Transcription elongation factor A protein 2 n=1 Tax=Fasciola hepatica TaxID=6192 RepID=A0A4E0R7K6_FASHE|nr:Transcription elongation factor A protein 2 [Fasciola hepatica]